jgi:exosome complex component RRP40
MVQYICLIDKIHQLLGLHMAAMTFVLPGDHIDSELLPSHPTLPIKLGPGLRHIPPNTITPVVAGHLCTDTRKNSIWIEFNGGRVSSPLPANVTITNDHSIFQPLETLSLQQSTTHPSTFIMLASRTTPHMRPYHSSPSRAQRRRIGRCSSRVP